jgi:hypothetical protein
MIFFTEVLLFPGKLVLIVVIHLLGEMLAQLALNAKYRSREQHSQHKTRILQATHNP